MEQAIEYATTVDGRRIASLAIGDGTPLLIAATPPFSHAQEEFRIPASGNWLRGLAQRLRVIRYDCRGTGLSDREPMDYSLEGQVVDMEAVADHYGLRRFALLGATSGSPASMMFAARHPERVSHFILWGPFVSGARLATRFPGKGFTSLFGENWQVATDAFAQASFGWADGETTSRYARLMRLAVTPEGMQALMLSTPEIDVTEDARAIRTPTLVITRRGATFSDPAEAARIAGLIPGARMLSLDGSSEVPFLEDPDGAAEAILEFIETNVEVRPSRPAPVPLTEREQQVLRLLANGHTGKEIAAELSVSVPTVQRHIANIYAKIGARGRVEAAAYAFEHGMVDRRHP